MNYQILQGDNRTTLKTIPDNSIDAIVTDPPYGIDFLGKAWDANTGALETYQECLRVLKPGGHILAFSAARTYHHLAVTLEQAGFEIRDQIMWIYSSGFPKSQDVGKQLNKKEIDNEWSGWGTALKPAHEPIALARKPIKLSIARNCQVHGVGALNIDATRIPVEGQDTRSGGSDGWDRVEFGEAEPNKYSGDGYVPNEQGRFPSNVIGEIPDYQKYFYCPKVNQRERHIGCDGIEPSQYSNKKGNGIQRVCETCGIPQMKASECKCLTKSWVMPTVRGNNHPTVKPIELMKYLIRLITPAGGTVLDPFNGSGSTGCAAVELGHPYIGCELDPAYVEIAQRRIEAWYADANPTTFNRLFDTE